jgi:hypothetical protein
MQFSLAHHAEMAEAFGNIDGGSSAARCLSRSLETRYLPSPGGAKMSQGNLDIKNAYRAI